MTTNSEVQPAGDRLDLPEHYLRVVDGIERGQVVPFLGAGVNLWGRPEGRHWNITDRSLLPNGTELATYLLSMYRLEEPESTDLARAAQFVSVLAGDPSLYEDLRTIFTADCKPSPLHEFLAGLPSFCRESPRLAATVDHIRKRLLLVTTNYDDLLESALRTRGEHFHTLSYVAKSGKFLHWTWPSTPKQPFTIHNPKAYDALKNDDDPIVLKLHGAVDRLQKERDSFVITEDDYIDYLTRTDASKLLPQPIPEKLKECGFLFLGYSLRDWNLRVMLHRIWSEQTLRYPSWSVQLDPKRFDYNYWKEKKVDVIKSRLEDYIPALAEALEQRRQSATPKEV